MENVTIQKWMNGKVKMTGINADKVIKRFRELKEVKEKLNR